LSSIASHTQEFLTIYEYQWLRRPPPHRIRKRWILFDISLVLGGRRQADRQSPDVEFHTGLSVCRVFILNAKNGRCEGSIANTAVDPKLVAQLEIPHTIHDLQKLLVMLALAGMVTSFLVFRSVLACLAIDEVNRRWYQEVDCSAWPQQKFSGLKWGWNVIFQNRSYPRLLMERGSNFQEW
jgi:hypothetical protein